METKAMRPPPLPERDSAPAASAVAVGGGVDVGGKGVAVGTTLALMMSIAALSLPEMLILRKVIRWQALVLFAGVLAIAFTLVGWGFNLIA